MASPDSNASPRSTLSNIDIIHEVIASYAQDINETIEHNPIAGESSCTSKPDATEMSPNQEADRPISPLSTHSISAEDIVNVPSTVEPSQTEDILQAQIEATFWKLINENTSYNTLLELHQNQVNSPNSEKFFRAFAKAMFNLLRVPPGETWNPASRNAICCFFGFLLLPEYNANAVDPSSTGDHGPTTCPPQRILDQLLSSFLNLLYNVLTLYQSNYLLDDKDHFLVNAFNLLSQLEPFGILRQVDDITSEAILKVLNVIVLHSNSHAYTIVAAAKEVLARLKTAKSSSDGSSFSQSHGR